MDVRQAIARLVEGGSLAEAEMEEVTRQLMAGEATPAQIGGLLVALRMKGESVEEITGTVRALRASAVRIRPRASAIVDTCGTGGDALGTFNISTAAAFIAAGAGVPIAKHGNRAMSGQVGGADVMEALGVRIDAPPERVAECIDTVGIGFLFAPVFHPAMKRAAAPRREIGVRTLFNLAGPLSNPAGARRQIVGVFADAWVEPLGRVLQRLGSEHCMIVHGEDGLDEISLTGPTQVCELRGGELRSYRIVPEDLGFARCSLADLHGGEVSAAAAVIRQILAGEADVARTAIAVLNAAAAIYVGGLAATVEQGAELARLSVESGAAARKLSQLVEASWR